jgi:hypothetical protein
MKNGFFILCTLILVSCMDDGRNGKNGANGTDGATIAGLNGQSTGVDFEDIAPGLACASGGISVFTFRDGNSDGVHQVDESVIKVKALCNGVNGLDGENASMMLESLTSSATCPNGGIKLTSGSQAPVEICNGVNGLNGEQGLPGVQGIPGMDGSDGEDGADGTIVTPVKFCANDNSTFPEYGLMIGNELYAVFWSTTPASPNTPQAFLTKLVPGNYMSTGGNNCLFSI